MFGLHWHNRRFLKISSVLLVVSITSVCWWLAAAEPPSSASHKPSTVRANARPVPIIPVAAVQASSNTIKTIQTSIGTVVPAAEVTVHARVAGQLTRVLFEEGQLVKKGQLLAEIDPRSFQADLAQIQGQVDRNQALVRNAEQDLERYQSLRLQSAISQQQIDAQKALVEQYRGALVADGGALARAQLELSFTRITAPIDGRIGLRNIDAGNNISPNDTEGLAVITQVQPVNVVFSVPEDSLPKLLQSLADANSGQRVLAVEAWDKANKQPLAQGAVISLDNRIDPATGTLKVKASFANQDARLFPNQFVNLRLELASQAEATLIPQQAVQRGSQGSYVFVVQTSGNPDAGQQSAALRLVKLGASEGKWVAVEEGLAVGEWVVTQGVDKLREGVKVSVKIPANTDVAPQAADAAPKSAPARRS